MKPASFFKQAIASLRDEGPKAAFFYVKGHILWMIHKNAINTFTIRAIKCSDCFNNGACLHCGCPFGPLALSEKPCKNDEHQDN